MSTYRIKQAMWAWGESFRVTDQEERVAYLVTGSFASFPKTFEIKDPIGQSLVHIEKKMWSLRPTYEVSLANGQHFSVRRSFSWLTDHFVLEDFPVELQGDLLGMNFELYDQGQLVARITKEWFRLTSTYCLDIYQEKHAPLALALTIIVDHVKASRQ